MCPKLPKMNNEQSINALDETNFTALGARMQNQNREDEDTRAAVAMIIDGMLFSATKCQQYNDCNK